MNRIAKSLLCFVLFGAVVSSAFALQPGDEAPAFKLKAQDGREVALADYSGKIVVLEWFNFGCPFSRNHYTHGNMQALQSDYAARGVVWLTLSSTNPQHKDFIDQAKAAEKYAELKFASAALLVDPDGAVGKAYGAKTTPHLIVIGKNGKVAYDGAIDDQPDPTADPAKAKSYLRPALDELLQGKPVSLPQTKPYGCSVKYAD